MTVSVTNVYDGPYTCNGVATVYPFSFSCGGVDEVRVWADYVALSAGFTVSVNANQSDNPGGSVTFATPPANGVKLLIWSNPTFLQETSFRDAGQFLASSHDDALDDAARRDLYLLDAFNRMAKVPIGETLNDFPPYAQRAGKFLGFDGSGQPVVLSGVGTDGALRGDIGAASGAGLVGKAGGGSVQDALNQIIGSYSFNLSNTGDAPWSITKTATGNAGGASDLRGVLYRLNYNGAYGTTNEITQSEHQLELVHTAGNVTFVYVDHFYQSLGTGTTGTATGSITSMRGYAGHTANKSSNAKAIAFASVFMVEDTDLDRSGVNGTIGDNRGLTVGNLGHASRITVSAVGVDVANFTAGAPITASFRSGQAAGTGCYAFLSTASAVSQFAGGIKVGAVSAQTEIFECVGNALVSGMIRSSGGRIGYAPGAGNTATQATSKATGVTLNKVTGQITLNNAALAAGAVVWFTLTNSFITADSDLRLWIKGGNATPGTYRVTAEGSASGSRTVVIENRSGGSLGEALILGFNVWDGQTS
jgi:hypothetical protein